MLVYEQRAYDWIKGKLEDQYFLEGIEIWVSNPSPKKSKKGYYGGDQIFNDIVDNLSRRCSIRRAKTISSEIKEITGELSSKAHYENVQDALYTAYLDIGRESQLNRLQH